MNSVTTNAPLAGEEAPHALKDDVPPQARIGAILPAALRTVWDRLGLLLGVSITWGVVVSLPLSIERWLPHGSPMALHFLALAAMPLLAALPTAGVFALAHRIATHQEALYTHLWQEGAALFGPALRLILIQTGAALLLFVACVFYARMTVWIGRAGLTVCGYALLLWGMMLIYQWPLLVLQEKGVFDEPERAARRGAFAAVRRSFYLALGRPFFTAALLGILLAASALMAATVVLSALLWIGAIAVASTFAARALLIQFRVLPPPVQEEAVPDLQFRLVERNKTAR